MSSAPSSIQPSVTTSPEVDPRRGNRISVLELVLAAVALLVVVGLRIRYASQIHFNSDEPQHLHVVWGWANGLLQYKDVFDNHAPLFDMILAPVLRLVGERPDVVIWMRLAMLPLFLICLWMVFVIGKQVFSARVGLWAAVVASVFPHIDHEAKAFTVDALFFFKMGEFRTDVLWTMFWLCSLAILVSGRISVRRCFAFGLALGAALAVSMKTILMVLAVLAAAGFVLGFQWYTERRISLKTAMKHVGAAVAGFVVMPVAIVAYFAMKHSLAPMYYCVVEHNRMPGSGLFDRARHSLWYLLPRVAGLAALSGYLMHRALNRETGAKQAFLLFVAGAYYWAVCGFWPIITPQDFQPSDPILAICVTALLLFLGQRLAERTNRPVLLGLPIRVTVVLGFVMILREESLSQHRTKDDVAMVRDVLCLTNPGEQIIDAKGECIYRPRAWYMVLETIARKKLRLGKIPDDLIAATIEKRAPLAHGLERMLEDDRAWFEKNYVQVGHVFVIGHILGTADQRALPFDTEIPETYAVVSNYGFVHGTLDGAPVRGPVKLEPGHHEFVPDGGRATQRLAVVWARAAERGYSPFGQTPHFAEN